MGWMEEKLLHLDRWHIPIVYDPHYLARESERNLDIGYVEKTVRMGSPVSHKGATPDRICFKCYFGKINEIYEVTVKIHRHFLEVKSAWKRKGKH